MCCDNRDNLMGLSVWVRGSDCPGLILYSTVCTAGRHLTAVFSDERAARPEEEGPQFNNLVVDKNTGRVYIGAVNKLYQLSPNLEPMVSTMKHDVAISQLMWKMEITEQK